jgi:hypothetical protein
VPSCIVKILWDQSTCQYKYITSMPYLYRRETVPVHYLTLSFTGKSSKSKFLAVSILLMTLRQRLTVPSCIIWASSISSLYVILPPSQNVRRLSFSQKSIFFKFDQVYMKKYEYLQISNGYLEKLYFLVNLLILI